MKILAKLDFKSPLDDKIDWLHFYILYIKYGLGRTSYDTVQEIRNGDITREEGIRLVKRFDSEFPKTNVNDCLSYMKISRNTFDAVIKMQEVLISGKIIEGNGI